MKRLLLLLAAGFLLAAALPARAQEAQGEVERLAWLTVELWPDYDRPEMLILMTGAVPADAPLPAAVTLPLPAEATINAVARITEDNALIDDIEFTTAEGSLTLITPDRRFRLEYYAPYGTAGAEKSYTFNWQSGLTVEEMAVAVQEPEDATSLEVEPPAVEVVTGFEDLNYHNLPPDRVPAGVPYTVTVSYQTERSGILQAANWPALLAAGGGVLVLLALVWRLWGNGILGGGRRLRKPRPARRTRAPQGTVETKQKGEASRAAKFCHRCGEEAQAGDRFCRNCGTQLKRAGS